MDMITFQLSTIIEDGQTRFYADGDPTDEDQLELFQTLEDFLQNIDLLYEFEDCGSLVTGPATPMQHTLMLLRFRPYLPI